MKTGKTFGEVVVLLAMSVVSMAAGPLEEAKSRYEAAIESEKEKTRTLVKALGDKYLAKLRSIEVGYQKSGDLENLLVVRKERERFAEARKLASGGVKRKPEDLRAVQQTFIGAQSRIGNDEKERLRKAAEVHLGALEKLVGELTRERKIEEALAVRKALEGLKKEAGLAANHQKPASKPAVPNKPAPEPVKKDFDTIKLSPVADASVRGGDYKRQNYGGKAELWVMHSPTYFRRRQRSYLKFDIGKLDTVARIARLNVTVIGRYGVDGKPDPPTDVHNALYTLPSDRDWEETTITMAHRPFKQKEFAKWKVPAVKEKVEVDVTALVRKAMDEGRKTISFHLYPVERGRRVIYASREHAEPECRPVLVIN